MHTFFTCVLLSGAVFLSSCSRYYLSVEKEKVNATYLASSVVNTPDPRSKNPPLGEKFIVEWYLSKAIMKKHPYINLDVLYWNYTQERIKLPIKNNLGYATYDILGDAFFSKKGVLAYKAEIVDEEGTVVKTWKHQLWVNVIKPQDDVIPTNEELQDVENESFEEAPPFDSSW